MIALVSATLLTIQGLVLAFSFQQLVKLETKPGTETRNYAQALPETDPAASVNKNGKTLEARFPAPKGFTRVAASDNSFTNYLRTLPLKPHGAPVLLHNGQPKNLQDVHAAVVDMEIGKQDLQQCADAIIRLRAEYLYQAKREKDIHFNFTSGDRASFTQYANGDRPVFTRNSVSWQPIGAPGNSYANFRKYLDMVFTYAGTASLEKELQPVAMAEVKPGDVLMQGGHPGHAVLVLDVAENPETKQKLLLLGQSYMPAQDIHVLVNPSSQTSSPWYQVGKSSEVVTPEWLFNTTQLKRFRD